MDQCMPRCPQLTSRQLAPTDGSSRPRQPFLSPLPRCLGPQLSAISSTRSGCGSASTVGQHRNLLAPNLDKTAADGHLDLVAVLLDKAQSPYLQRGQKRDVSGEDAETPLATGRLQAGYLPE